MDFIVKLKEPVEVKGYYAGFRHVARAREILGLPTLSERLVYGWINGLRIGSIYVPKGFIDKYSKLKDIFWNTNAFVIRASSNALVPFTYEYMDVQENNDGAIKGVTFSLRLNEAKFLDAWVEAGCPDCLSDKWFDDDIAYVRF